MSHTTSIRRALTVAGATGILAFSVAAPASARPDPGNGAQSEWSCQTDCYPGGTTPGPTITVDDNALELLQLGGGVLAGLALAGAGVALASRRTHTHAAHPA